MVGTDPLFHELRSVAGDRCSELGAAPGNHSVRDSFTAVPPDAWRGFDARPFGDPWLGSDRSASKLLFEKITELLVERVEMTWLRALATLLERVGSTALPSPVNNSITGIGA